jgi:antirestriction protein ArdC
MAKEVIMRDVYSNLTDQIIAALENGVQPWFKPWTATTQVNERPIRFNGQPYHGVNVMILWMTARMAGYTSPCWMTFKQAKDLGGHIRKGQKGTDIFYANRITVDQNTDAERVIPVLRTYNVFNCDQIADLPTKYQPVADIVVSSTNERIAEVDTFFGHLNMTLRHGGNQAVYSPSDDDVRMPHFETFKTAEDYYCTLGHETVHWTKAPHRLDRKLGQQRWGDAGYAMEELVAEIGAAYLAADLKIAAQPRADHASYIAHWLTILKGDKRAIVTAASLAERAVTYLHQQQPSYIPAEAEAA